MDHIQLIRDRAELDGTGYFELLPGRYEGKHWNDDSLFIPEETFGYMEDIIVRYAPHFSHFSFTDVSRAEWRLILPGLESLADCLEEASSLNDVRDRVCFLWEPSEKRFMADFPDSARALALLIRELVVWADAKLERHEHLAILGI